MIGTIRKHKNGSWFIEVTDTPSHSCLLRGDKLRLSKDSAEPKEEGINIIFELIRLKRAGLFAKIIRISKQKK